MMIVTNKYLIYFYRGRAGTYGTTSTIVAFKKQFEVLSVWNGWRTRINKPWPGKGRFKANKASISQCLSKYAMYIHNV